MSKHLRTIMVAGEGTNDEVLRLHYSDRDKMNAAASALRLAGFTVTGEYDPALILDASADDAFDLARVFCR